MRRTTTKSLLVVVIINNDALIELGVLVTSREPEGGRGRCRRNRIIITHGTPTVAKALLELVLGDDEALLNIMVLLTVETDCLHDSRLSLAQERGKTSTRSSRGGRHGGTRGLRPTNRLPRRSRCSSRCRSDHAHMNRRLPNGMHNGLSNLKWSSVINYCLNEWSMRELTRLKKTGETDLMPNIVGCVKRLSRCIMHMDYQINAVVASP